MTDYLNILGNYLAAFTSWYLAYHFARVLYVEGTRWIFAKFAIAGVILFSAIAVRFTYPALTRALASDGEKFHGLMDDSRWIIHMLTGAAVLIGGYLYKTETMEIKDPFIEIGKFVFIAFLAIVAAL